MTIGESEATIRSGHSRVLVNVTRSQMHSGSISPFRTQLPESGPSGAHCRMLRHPHDRRTCTYGAPMIRGTAPANHDSGVLPVAHPSAALAPTTTNTIAIF